MVNERLKISPPWCTYINKLQALFDGDPQIAFNIDLYAENPKVVISTNNGNKAAALIKLLPSEISFGNVTLLIDIDCVSIPNIAFITAQELFDTVFEGNPAFAYTVTTDGAWYPLFTYVVFKNCVVQFFNDNLNDPHGVISTLYQDIAAEIFEDCPFIEHGVSFCTDVERKLGKPLGEWP